MKKIHNFENLKFDKPMRDTQKVLDAVTSPYPIRASRQHA